jgi:hypothetical protein
MVIIFDVSALVLPLQRVLALVLRNDVLHTFQVTDFEFNRISRTYCGRLDYWKYKSGAICLVEAQVEVPKKSGVLVASQLLNCVYCLPVRYQRKVFWVSPKNVFSILCFELRGGRK